ncbi:hypothetical protein [Sinomonas sp.]|jgi:putative NADH-flavin reductase|uniref:hypothetical protein n=1 Tax=Sinomonas sp. TaxID=1914986 RepID=UPI003FA72D45
MPDSQERKAETPKVHEHHVLDRFMHVTDQAVKILVQPHRGDINSPVVHKHDVFEDASEEDLRGFEVVTDSEGHHYAVRKEHH